MKFSSLQNQIERQRNPQSSQTSLLDAPEIDWQPRAGTTQELAFHSSADVTLYAGQPGAGKTDLTLGKAFLQHSNSIIFRREYPQLVQCIDRSIEMVGDEKHYNRTTKVWRYKKIKVEFGAVQRLQDWKKYQGRPHDLTAFDEITHFPYELFINLTAWNRTVDPSMRCKILATGNPPTDAVGMWIIDYWAPWLSPDYEKKTGRRKAESGEIRWFVFHPDHANDIEVDSGDPIEYIHESGEVEILYPSSRTFIRGVMLPELERTGYRRTLQRLPEPMRSQLLKGLFVLSKKDNPWQLIKTSWVEAAMQRWQEDRRHFLDQEAIGVDVARGGKHRTVIAELYDEFHIAALKKYPGSETPTGKIVATDVAATAHHKDTKINIDLDGIGSAPYDFLIEWEYTEVYGIHNGASVKEVYDEETLAELKRGKHTMVLKFENMRSFLWWRLAQLLDPENHKAIELPPDEDLKFDLTTYLWFVRQGKICLETKEQMRKRLELPDSYSTDCGDAVVNAFAPDNLRTFLWDGVDL